MVFTTRLSGGNDGRNRFETLLDSLGIVQKNSRPNHPTTCGKIELFHQTLKRWLTAHPAPATIDELQALLDAFVNEYNHRRPHCSLDDRTPVAAYHARPKAAPAGTHQPHHRVRHDRVSHGNVSLRVGGVLHHIGPVATSTNPHDHAHRRPRCAHHPRHHRRDPPPTHHRPNPPLPPQRTTRRRTTTILRTPKNEARRTLNAGSAVSDVSRHHISALGGSRTPTFGSVVDSPGVSGSDRG
jgi:hypothetical protein